MPIKPWNAAPDSLVSPSFEIQAFGDVALEPYTSLLNLLYIYPLMLKYDGQKFFSKARNIVCTIQFVAASSRGGDRVKVSYFN